MLVQDGLARHRERFASIATELARLDHDASKTNRGFWLMAHGPASRDERTGERRIERPSEPSPPNLPYDPGSRLNPLPVETAKTTSL